MLFSKRVLAGRLWGPTPEVATSSRRQARLVIAPGRRRVPTSRRDPRFAQLVILASTPVSQRRPAARQLPRATSDVRGKNDQMFRPWS